MSRIRRIATLGVQSAGLAALGFVVTGAPGLRALPDFLRPPTNEGTVSLAKAAAAMAGGAAQVAEDAINASTVAQEARRAPPPPLPSSPPGPGRAAVLVAESRPQLKIHAAHARRSLTAGTLSGEGRTTVPPVMWTRTEVDGGGGGDDVGMPGAPRTATTAASLTSVWHVGGDVCGHQHPESVVHTGYLATMLDEGLARCCIGLLPHRVALTAELRVDYVRPVPANSFVVLRAQTTRVAGRKAWVEARLETLEEADREPQVLARATALFVSPRTAGPLATLYPVA